MRDNGRVRPVAYSLRFRPAAPGGNSHHVTRDRLQPMTVLSVRVEPGCYLIPFIAFFGHHTTGGFAVKADQERLGRCRIYRRFRRCADVSWAGWRRPCLV